MRSKKLLVLDVNGLLMDTYFYKEPLPDESPDARVGSFYVYKRPFCEEFLQFCLENFIVGIWSSAREYNVNNLVDYVFGGTKEKLAFSWHQSDCTDLGLKSPDNERKPLFLKELAKLWRRVRGDLPWKEGSYGPSNTLLVDDTPYKAILNPPNTAIFPPSYTARNRGDNFLGGALRSYLEGIRDAQCVQTYVETNPFGEPSITAASPLWSYVNEVMLKVKNVSNNGGDGATQIVPVGAVINEFNMEDKPERCQGERTHYSGSLQQVVVSNEDYQDGKQMRWRNRKQKYQPANNHLRSSDFDFPSEIVESQSSERQLSDCMLQQPKSGEQDDGFYADQQVRESANVGSQGMVDTPLYQTGWVCHHASQSNEKQERPLKQERPSQFGEGIQSLPSRLEGSLDAVQDRSNLSTDRETCDGNDEDHCKNPGYVLSFEQEQQGALQLGKLVGSMQEDFKRMGKNCKENQTMRNEMNRRFGKHGNAEGSFTRVTGAELDRVQEGHRDVAAGNHHSEGNESTEKLFTSVGDDSLSLSEPYCMQAEGSSQEPFHERWKTRNTDSVHGSNNTCAPLYHSNGRGHQRRETPEELNMGCPSRPDTNRDRFSYDQGWKGKERYSQVARSGMPYSRHSHERRHHFTNIKRMDRQNSNVWYQNKTYHSRYPNQRWGSKRLAQPAWPSNYDSRSWDQPPAQPAWPATHDSRSWDQSRQDWWQVSNRNTSTDASFRGMGGNFSTSQGGSTGWVGKYDEHGQGQDREPLSTLWQQGYDQGEVCERSNSFPERVEQWNVNGHIPEELAAVQAESIGNGNRHWFDLARKEVGASSQLHSGALSHPYQDAEPPSQPLWNAEAFGGQPYREQYGGPMQVYHNASTYQPYHNSGNQYWQALPFGECSTSRQSQEIRNL